MYPPPFPNPGQGSLPGENNIKQTRIWNDVLSCFNFVWFLFRVLGVFVDLGGFGVLNGPPPIPIPDVSQSSLPGEKYRKNKFLLIWGDFCDLF